MDVRGKGPFEEIPSYRGYLMLYRFLNFVAKFLFPFTVERLVNPPLL